MVSQKRNVLGLLGAFVVMSLIGGVLAAGLAMPAVGASGMLTKGSVDFFDSLPSELTQEPQAENTRVLAADGSLLATFFEENRDVKPLKDISKSMQDAIIAIEDSRFYEHTGVDPKGLTRAAIVNQITGRTAQGASTLTQQYVKNVLILGAVAEGDVEAAKAARAKTTARKVEEIAYAVALEKELSKEEILERYLNIAFFGHTLYGVQAAAKYYFGTTAKKLTVAQAATLAGMIQQPGAYNPEENPKESQQRRDVVLARMLELKKIDQLTHDTAKATKTKLKITKTPNGCANAKNQYGYYCEYVRRLIIGSKGFSALGKTADEREQTLMRGGLTIKTAMDPKVMKAAWKAVKSTIPPKDKSNVSTASVTVEPGTGKVLSIQQNKTYGNAEKKRTGFWAENYSVDEKWGGGKGFQTGSTFKPFTLAAWLDAGKSLNTVVPSSGGVAAFSAFEACGKSLRGGSYTYQNANEGRTSSSTMSVWNGTAGSVNGVYVSMEKQLDLCKIRETAEDIGVHLASSRDDVCSTKKGKRTTRLPICVPSLTLGVENISPMTMAGAYAAFAADGKFCKPTAVLQILDRNNKRVKIPGADCKQTLDKKVAEGVNKGLSRVFKSGGTVGSTGALPGREASGKTGTTNDSVDTWFVGYTRQLATAVWVGDPFSYKRNGQWARRSMNGRTIAGTARSGVYGATFAAPIWKQIMTTASKGMEVKSLG